MSLSDWPLDPAHTHTHTQSHLHARDWNQLGRHSSMNQMSATSHRERRGAHVNYYREKSYCFTCKTCHPGYLWIMKSFSFFPSWDEPRGDTISMSRSLKAVINFVMQALCFPTSFIHFMHLCCVHLSGVNCNNITQKMGVNPSKVAASQRKLLIFWGGGVFPSKCHGITDVVWSRAVKRCLLWQEQCKVLERCLQISSRCNATLSFDLEHAGGKNTASFFFWQHVSHVTLNLWRFPILSDHSLFGSC